jgi:hypothetical protein
VWRVFRLLRRPSWRRPYDPTEWGAKWGFPSKRYDMWKGWVEMWVEIQILPPLVLNWSNFCRPGGRFEEVLYLFKRALLFAAYKTI